MNSLAKIAAICLVMFLSGCGPSLTIVGTVPGYKVIDRSKVPMLYSTGVDGGSIVLKPRFVPSVDKETYLYEKKEILQLTDKKLNEFASTRANSCAYTITKAFGDYYTEGTLQLKQIVVVKVSVEIKLGCANAYPMKIESIAHTGQISLDEDVASRLEELVVIAVANAVIEAFLSKRSPDRAKRHPGKGFR